MALREKIISADEFWELSHSADDELRRDLIDGVVYEMSPAGAAHGIIAGNVFGFVWTYVRQHGLGSVTAAETGYVLHKNPDGKDTVLAPDVAFISKERMTSEPSLKFVPFAPDLAVEVVSPTDTYHEVAIKIRRYLAYGTRLVWIVDPKARTVEVHFAGGMKTLQAEDTLDGGDVLPGFTLPVRDFFPEGPYGSS